MCSNPFLIQRRAPPSSDSDMLCQQILHAVWAESCSSGIRKDNLAVAPSGLLQPELQSTSLGLRHLSRERNFASGVVCDAMASGRAPAEAKTENAVVFCKARFRARFLWFCGESIGEARVRSLRLSR